MKIITPILSAIGLFIAFLMIVVFNLDADPKSYEEDY